MEMSVVIGTIILGILGQLAVAKSRQAAKVPAPAKKPRR